MKRTLLLIGTCAILAISLFVLKPGTLFRRESDVLKIYSQLVNGQLPSARSGSDIIDLLGNPDHKSDFMGNELWSYGPNLYAVKHSKKGDIIGINVYVDKRSSVIRCTAITRD